jgi:hypothetical protein
MCTPRLLTASRTYPISTATRCPLRYAASGACISRSSGIHPALQTERRHATTFGHPTISASLYVTIGPTFRSVTYELYDL